MTNVQRINPDAPEVRAVDLPEVRAETVRILSDPRVDDMVWGELARESETRGNSGDAVRKAFMGGLRRADLYWVSDAMSELTEVGAETVPTFDIQPEDLPSRDGLMLFERPVTAATAPATSAEEETVKVQMDGLLWTTVAWPAGEGVAVFSLYLGRGLYCHPLNLFALAFGVPVPRAGQFDYFRAMRTAWLLMRQPLAEAEEVEEDRASRKRTRRAGYEPKPIRVINLRRPQGENGGTGESNYHHQWIVRGHWRNHWHPKRQVHRPVWIAPHVKGPEGAPMIGGEKVYAWKK